MLEYRQTLDMGTENLLIKENWQHLHGDLPAHHPHEHDQPGHQLHHRVHQVRHDLQHQHHLHDGPRLHLPLSVRQSASHGGYQTCGGLADLQPRVPFHHNSSQRLDAGSFLLYNSVVVDLTFILYNEIFKVNI